MDDDVRAALQQAAGEAPHPGLRLQRWEAEVSRLAAHASAHADLDPVDRAVDAVAQAALGLRPPRRGARLLGAAAALVALATVMATGGFHLSGTGRLGHLGAGGARIDLALAGATTCPVGETRYDNLGAGYHLCLPAGWNTTDYSGSAVSDRAVNVTGLDGSSGPATGIRRGSQGPDAAILITVWAATLEDIEAADGLGGGADVPVAGGTGRVYVSGGDDPAQQRRTMLVQHGDRTYEVEQLRAGPAFLADMEEVLRTLAFQGLPYFADPDFKLNQSSA